jgi:hypothetical protein
MWPPAGVSREIMAERMRAINAVDRIDNASRGG